jgi:hypothetical protein
MPEPTPPVSDVVAFAGQFTEFVNAMREMLFAGGALMRNLLGGGAETPA